MAVRFVRRHILAIAPALLILAGAVWSLPPLVDAVTGALPGEAVLTRPFLYVVLAPISNALDALTFLSLERAYSFVAVWTIVLVVWSLWKPVPWWRRGIRAVGAIAAVALALLAAVLAPRPVPFVRPTGSGQTILDYHAHTSASHDGRKGFGPAELARWHAVQGFDATYVTDHNTVFSLPIETAIPLLPGVEWSVHRQHVVALGPVRDIERARFSNTTPNLLGIFAELHRQGALGIASLPEYWANHREDLELFVAAGVDGFEIVNCSPKGLAFSSASRRSVIELAAPHDLLVLGASDNHGWGKVTCVWNVSRTGLEGFRANRVLARPVALAQGDAAAWSAPLSQIWLMFRGLDWDERASWLTWIALISIYRAIPRREGQKAGLGILFRSVFQSRTASKSNVEEKRPKEP